MFSSCSVLLILLLHVPVTSTSTTKWTCLDGRHQHLRKGCCPGTKLSQGVFASQSSFDANRGNKTKPSLGAFLQASLTRSQDSRTCLTDCHRSRVGHCNWPCGVFDGDAPVILEIPGTLCLRALRATVLPLVIIAIILAGTHRCKT